MIREDAPGASGCGTMAPVDGRDWVRGLGAAGAHVARTHDIGFLVFDGVKMLDVAGPSEVNPCHDHHAETDTSGRTPTDI